MLLADRIIVMDAGSIVESGTPQALYRTPRFRLTAEIFGATNLVPVQHDGEFGRLPWGQVVRLASATAPASDSATCAIRPEALSVVSDPSGAATVVKLQFMGSSVRCEIDVAGRRLLAAVDAKSTIPPAGTRVALRAEEPLHILEEPGAAA
jgi:ABC-type Fe3+/spermidine/putrescine transport system ATPase subunit